MKKRISIFLCLTVLILTACAPLDNSNDTQVDIKPDRKEPPVLTVKDESNMTAQARVGTYTWFYDNEDGTKGGVCADSVHPLEWDEFLVPLVTSDASVRLCFAVEPQELSVRCWSDADWGNTEAPEKQASLDGYVLELEQGGYIFEVIAKWTGNDLPAEGTVHYGFYVICDDHAHTVPAEPQTVDDPVTGYCGNMVTKIDMDGSIYSFEGADSVCLTDILINLKYDPDKLCRCMTEFSVETESGVVYGVNLTQGYSRCEAGQADLTQEQIIQIEKVLKNQTQ